MHAGVPYGSEKILRITILIDAQFDGVPAQNIENEVEHALNDTTRLL